MTTDKAKLGLVPEDKIDETNVSVPKPAGFSTDKFKSKHATAAAKFETLLTALPIYTISEARDYVRLHPDEDAYWSPELCFVNVPIKGSQRDTLHLIDEEIGMQYLPPARVSPFRLALATKPFDVSFLCRVPSRNLDNTWNAGNLQACVQAKERWTQATSQKEAGIDGYKVEFAPDADAFPEPKWPKQTLDEIIGRTFEGRMIETEDHPGLLRLRGKKQSVT
jgi:hypothetical protein